MFCFQCASERFFLLKTPVTVWQRKSSGGDTAPITLQHPCFFPAVKVLSDEVSFHEGGCDQELSFPLLLERLGSYLAECLERNRWEVPVLLVPKPIFLLMKEGKWKSLILHLMGAVPGRDPRFFHKECIQFVQSLMQFPSPDCFRSLWSNRFLSCPPPSKALTVESVAFVLQLLRSHSEDILASAGHGASERLLGAIEGLEVFTETLDSRGGHIKGRKANALQIIEGIRAVSFLRNRGHFNNIKNAVVDSLVPAQLQDLTKAMMYGTLSASSLSKFQARPSSTLTIC